MDLNLEQAILEAISDSLKGKKPIQEAEEDWITATETIATIEAFSADEPPPVNKRTYGPASAGQQKHYPRLIRKKIRTAFLDRIKKQHDEAVAEYEEKGENPNPDDRRIFTQEKIVEKFSQYAPLPKTIAARWNQERRTRLANIENLIKIVENNIESSLEKHARLCPQYQSGGCISGTKIDIDLPEVAYDAENAARELKTIIQNTGTSKSGRQCSPAFVGLLQQTLNSLILDEKSLNALTNEKTYIQLYGGDQLLTDNDFIELADSEMGMAIMKSLGLDIQPPLLSAKPKTLDQQVVAYIVDSAPGPKKGEDLCQQLSSYTDELKSEYESGDYDFYNKLAVSLSSYYTADEVRISFEDALEDWPDRCQEFIELARPKYELDPNDLAISDISPLFAVPGSSQVLGASDLSKIPRLMGDNFGIGGVANLKSPTVYSAYNARVSGRLPEGFPEDYSWLIIYGTEESAVKSNPDGKCQICKGSGYITSSEDVGITINGEENDDYWNLLIGDIDQEHVDFDANNVMCDYCEGTGKVYPKIWLLGNDRLTPFEQVIEIVWNNLVSLGLNPQPYDGFVTSGGKPFMVKGSSGNFPIPAPMRPEVIGQHQHNVPNEQNVAGYTVIIRLDNPMGNSRTNVNEYFVDQFGSRLTADFKRYRLGSEINDFNRSGKQIISVWGWRQEPKAKFRRVRSDIFRTGEDSEKEALAINDLEEFDQQYLQIKSARNFPQAPSQRFVADLLKLKKLADDLQNARLGPRGSLSFRVAVPIYSFLGLDHALKSQSRLIDNYDMLVEEGRKMSYFSLLQLAIIFIEKNKDQFKHPDQYIGQLERLRDRANLFELEDQSKDQISKSLQFYMRETDSQERMQRRLLFKPGKDVLPTGERIRSSEDLYSIARRINKVFAETSAKHPISNRPENASDNPVPYLLVPIGGDLTAQELVSVSDLEIVRVLIKNYFKTSNQRKVLAKLYWRSQLEGRKLLDVLRSEGSMPGKELGIQIADSYPGYNLVDKIAEQFDNDNQKNPAESLVKFFETGYEMTQKLYEKIGLDKVRKIYQGRSDDELESDESSQKRATPESDLRKLSQFVDKSSSRLIDRNARRRLTRHAKARRELDPQKLDAARQDKQDDNWKKDRNRYLGKKPRYRKFSDLEYQILMYIEALQQPSINDIAAHLGKRPEQVKPYLNRLRKKKAIDGEAAPTLTALAEENLDFKRKSIELQLWGYLRDFIKAAVSILPELRVYRQLLNRPSTLLRQLSPMLERYLIQNNLPQIDFDKLFSPGTEADFSQLVEIENHFEMIYDRYISPDKTIKPIDVTAKYPTAKQFFKNLFRGPDAST